MTLTADATPTPPSSLADSISEGEDRLVANTGKVEGEEYLKEECETGRDTIEVDSFYYTTSNYFGD